MITASASQHAAPAFNGLFYATVATIIPVLFLAVAVQGNTYARVLKAGTDGMRRMFSATDALSDFPETQRPRKARLWLQVITGYVITVVALLAAGVFLGSASIAETGALTSLYHQRATSPPRGELNETIVTAAAVALAAAAAFAWAFISGFLPEKKHHPAQAPDTHGPNATPAPQIGSTAAGPVNSGGKPGP